LVKAQNRLLAQTVLYKLCQNCGLPIILEQHESNRWLAYDVIVGTDPPQANYNSPHYRTCRRPIAATTRPPSHQQQQQQQIRYEAETREKRLERHRHERLLKELQAEAKRVRPLDSFLTPQS
jgi:hypothetical protein